MYRFGRIARQALGLNSNTPAHGPHKSYCADTMVTSDVTPNFNFNFNLADNRFAQNHASFAIFCTTKLPRTPWVPLATSVERLDRVPYQVQLQLELQNSTSTSNRLIQLEVEVEVPRSQVEVYQKHFVISGHDFVNLYTGSSAGNRVIPGKQNLCFVRVTLVEAFCDKIPANYSNPIAIHL